MLMATRLEQPDFSSDMAAPATDNLIPPEAIAPGVASVVDPPERENI
jgi:hypothetical protein